MIGSSTLVVKEKGKFRVYQFGGFIPKPTFKGVVANIKGFKGPQAANLNETDAYQILSSHNCIDEYHENYSEYCGDQILLLDLDSRKLIDREKFVKTWATKYPKKIQDFKKDFQRRKRSKIRKIYAYYRKLEAVVLDVMEKRQHEPLTTERVNNTNYHQPKTFDVQYNKNQRDVHFFEGHANRIGGITFADWFIKRRKNLTPLLKRYSQWGKEKPRIWTTIYSFTHKGRKWIHDCSGTGSGNEIREFIK